MKVAIVGLGMIGGSLARDLAALGVTVVGFDRTPATLRAARRTGVISESLGADLAGVERCDVCVIAVPVDATVALIEQAAPRLLSVPLITDVGSTKRTIIDAALRAGLGARFVGSHPFTGDHRTGWRASRRGLFLGERVFLSPTRISRPAAMARARRMWRMVGAAPEAIGAAVHDAFVARASHLPQIVSSALGRVLAEAGVSRAQLGPGGRDVTRLAGSDPAAWSAIAMANADLLAPLLAMYERAIRRARTAIASGRAQSIRRHFEAGHRWSAAP
ncbi:MAG: prephenate dehydrogenase/arogenate dehydrogenase family protein [Gemmatimonadetes bacterium]|nr:prephenate dehydrogenase/arogenate dehydrogenase family protein [Gemmatimonadota bacterium]